MRLRIFLLGALVLLSSACSLVKLSDDIAQANCKNDADCDVLNDKSSKSFDACELWQCSKSSNHCEFLPLDSDHDNFTPETVTVDGEELMCEVKADKQDCDDDNDARKPGGKERCDNLDNDCDLNVDEGVLDPKSDVALTFTGDIADGAGDATYAVDPATGAVAIGYSINRQPAVPGFTILKNELPAGANATALRMPEEDKTVLFADAVGVSALGAGKFAAAMYNTSGASRLLAGTVSMSAGDEPIFHVSKDVSSKGLHCAASEAAACKTETPDTRPPALAALGDTVVVSYVRAPADVEGCHKRSDSVAAHPVLANALSVTADGLAELTTKAVEVGSSSSLEAPTLVSIAAFGWLVAYVNENGGIELRQLSLNDDDTLSVSSVLSGYDDKTQRFASLSMVLGPKIDDKQVVGIAFRRGCVLDARAGLMLFEVETSSTPKIKRLTDPVLVGGSPNESRPSVAFSKSRKTWGVAYHDPKGVQARMLDQDGKLLGTEPYLLSENVKSGSGMFETLLTPKLVASTGDGWFGALSYGQRAGTNPFVFQAVTLASCAKKD